MRDINRIEPFIEKLLELWKLYPDLRFFQLVEFIKKQLNVVDAFYIEDNETLKIIENLLKANSET